MQLYLSTPLSQIDQLEKKISKEMSELNKIFKQMNIEVTVIFIMFHPTEYVASQ